MHLQMKCNKMQRNAMKCKPKPKTQNRTEPNANAMQYNGRDSGENKYITQISREIKCN